MKKDPKRWRRIAIASVCVPMISLLACNVWVSKSGAGRIYANSSDVPYHRVGIVLGTAPLFNGRPNPFFYGRIEAAANLYKAHRVQVLLVSGDNSRTDYDEPGAMRKALIDEGIPAAAIRVDDAGFRTLDTVVRAKKVFGVTDCTFVTDDFHMPRTLYLADQEGLVADGLASRHVAVSEGLMTNIRELGARTLVVIDVLTGRGARYLGPKEPI